MSITPPRTLSRLTLHPVLPALLCATALAAGPEADDPPRPPTGQVRLAGGRDVGYTIHFDRNSLRDGVRLDDSLIALTSSGTLLRFDLPAVRLVRERMDVEEVTCLGRGEGGAVHAGLADGRVCRVDPETLGLTELAKLPAPPRWVGWGEAGGGRPAGLVVVIRPTRPVDRDGRHWDVPYSVVNDLASGKTVALEEEATAVLLDRAGRVWLGADKGEWGGRVWRVDLAQGTATALKPPPPRAPDPKAFWEGVYGFIERPGGAVWAFGGTSHMGFNSGFVTRVDGPEPRPLAAFEPPRGPGKEPDPGRPRLPITHVVDDGAGLLVFSYSDVFRVDEALAAWKKVATLDLGYRWGRPDAVGAYPAVCAVNPPPKAGGPVALATVGDGYVVLEGARVTPRGLPGQLGAEGVERVLNTAEGTFFVESDDRLPAWRLGAKDWEVAALAPPVEPDPGNDAAGFEKGDKTWYETHLLVGPGGMVYSVNGTAVSPGTRTTARRVAGKAERIGRETSSLIPAASFLAPDGSLRNAFYGELKRFEMGRWGTVARMPRGEGPSRLEALDADGPPWLLRDPHDDRLWRLEHGARGEAPRLTRVEIREGGKALHVHDAIRWTGGAMLLATEVGLRAYAPATGVLSRPDLPEPRHPPTALARDGLGRVWLGGEKGLWLSAPGAKAPESLEGVPWIGRGGVKALVPDPQHADGVVVALGERGVAFVRAGQKP